MRIAVTGKGGSGKTVLTALMTRFLAGERSVLAIDADSAVSLPYALGMEPPETVASIRRGIIEDPATKARMDDTSIADVMQGLLAQGDGFHLLVMGRPEGPGCFCAVNDLLRYGIDALSVRFDVTLIDCEAGPEQLNRRVVKGVDLLLVVTDPSMRAIRVAKDIASVARSDEALRPAGGTRLVVNRSLGRDDAVKREAAEAGLEILGIVPEDPAVPEADAAGRPVAGLPDSSPGVAAVKRLVGTILREP
jgi:CO dehydrogenase maturation factor